MVYAASETQNKTQHIQTERNHPEKRNSGNVLRDVIGNGQQERGAAGGECDPKRSRVPPKRWSVGSLRRSSGFLPLRNCNRPASAGECRIAKRPTPALVRDG